MVEIFADSSALSRGLASAQSKMAKFATTMRRLGTAQVLVGVGIAAPVAAAVRQYALLEQKLNTIRSLTGATAGQMARVTQQVRQIGMVTGQPFVDVAQGMGDLSRAGVKLQDLGSATRVISDFSRAASVDMARAAEIGVSVLTEFGLSIEHLPRIADVMQEMANATVSTVEDLSEGFRYAGQTAKQFGLSLEQAGSAIAFLQQSGLPGSTAGTALNQMLLQTVKNLDKVEGAIGNLRDAAGEFLPFDQILNKLRDHVKNMPGPERLQFLNDMFDVRGMRGASALLQNVEAWIELNRQADASMGASKAKAGEMSKAFMVSFDKMRNGLVDMSYAIGEVLDGTLRDAFETLANFTTALGPFIKANAGAVVAVAKFAAALTASGVAFFAAGITLQLAAFSFEGFVKLGRAAISPITGVVRAVELLGSVAYSAAGSLMYVARGAGFMIAGLGRGAFAAVRAITVALGALSIGTGEVALLSLGAAVVGVAVGMALLRKSADGVGALFGAIGSGVSRVWQGLAVRGKQAFVELRGIAAAGWRGVVDAINAGDLSLAWDVFVLSAKAAFSQVMVVVGPLGDDMMFLFRDIAEKFKTVFWEAVRVGGNVFASIKSLAEPVAAVMADIGDSLVSSLSGAMNSASWSFDYLGRIAEHAGNRIFSALSAGDIVRAWHEATTAIASMFVVLGSAWDRHVAKPIQLAAVRAAEGVQEREIRMRAHAAAHPDETKNFRRGDGSFADKILDILDSGSPEELARARGSIGMVDERGNAAPPSPKQAGVIADAVDMVTARFKQLGIQTEDARKAEVARKVAALYAASADKMKAIEDERAANATKRRADADRAAAAAAGAADRARGARDIKEFEGRIAAAAKPAEIEALWQELKTAAAKSLSLDRTWGVEPTITGGMTDQEAAAAQIADDKKRARSASIMREEAARMRRAGDERGAAEYEDAAAKLVAAVDKLEFWGLRDKIDDQRRRMAEEQRMRERAAGAGGELAQQKAREIDSIGGFMSSAFDRIGYSPNLAERQLKAAEEGAKNGRELVDLVRRGGVFV
jgi:TP901 family phage tail tape measure protein